MTTGTESNAYRIYEDWGNTRKFLTAVSTEARARLIRYRKTEESTSGRPIIVVGPDQKRI